MKGVVVTLVLFALLVGFIFLRRRQQITPPVLTTLAPPVGKNPAQKLEDLLSKKTGVPLSAVGHASEAVASTLWHSGVAGKVGAVALAPLFATTAAVQTVIDKPGATARAVANGLQTGASSVGHAIVGAPPAVANVVVGGAVSAEHAVVGAAKSVGSAAKSVGKKILSIF